MKVTRKEIELESKITLTTSASKSLTPAPNFLITNCAVNNFVRK